MKEFFVYGSAGFCLFVVIGCVAAELHDRLKERREVNRVNRAVRRWKECNLVPDDMLTLQESLDLEEWVDTVELSGDERWVRDGLEMLSIHATVAQRPDGEIGTAA